jgi:hypothetical protein
MVATEERRVDASQQKVEMEKPSGKKKKGRCGDRVRCLYIILFALVS